MARHAYRHDELHIFITTTQVLCDLTTNSGGAPPYCNDVFTVAWRGTTSKESAARHAGSEGSHRLLDVTQELIVELLGRPRECAASLPKAMLEFVYK